MPPKESVMRIQDLRPNNDEEIRQIAAMLVEGFRENWPDAWPDMNAAVQEVQDAFAPGRISRFAEDESSGEVLGWIAAIQQHKGKLWELHPMVVHPKHQRCGVGRALVADLEERVREYGGLTLWLGTDDENGMTTLSNVNLYPNVWDHISKMRNLRGHPFEFYLKLGFVIVGVLPDANGPGKPDIFMAKSLAQP